MSCSYVCILRRATSEGVRSNPTCVFGSLLVETSADVLSQRPVLEKLDLAGSCSGSCVACHSG